jgi:hypothetical protein
MVIGGDAGKISIYDVKKMKLRLSWNSSNNSVKVIKWTDDGK